MLDRVSEIARKAGAEILRIYNSSYSVAYKSDASPLTDADRAAHEVIAAALPAVIAGVPVVSEEGSLPLSEMQDNSFWLVDPLDGTKEFLKRTGDFTVNIALISNRVPVLGVVYVPGRDLMYFAESSKGAWKQTGSSPAIPIRTRRADIENLCLVASKDHAGPEVEQLFKKLPGAQLANMGSSLKFCLVAEGQADFYPRFGPTMEWDTAAAHSVLLNAGGAVYDLSGNALSYNKLGFKNSPFVAVGDTTLPWKSWF